MNQPAQAATHWPKHRSPAQTHQNLYGKDGENDEVNGEDDMPADDISSNIRAARLEFANWTWSWGPESLWGRKFDKALQVAREGDREDLDDFFAECEGHASNGRDILQNIRFAAAGSCNNTMGEITDLFMQGYDMVIAITSEVKFFKVKLDEYAPAVPMTKISDVCSYSGL